MSKIIITAIVGAVVLTGWALYLGYNGVLLTTVTAGLLYIAGVKTKDFLKSKK